MVRFWAHLLQRPNSVENPLLFKALLTVRP
jgi:hypothetical protein